MKVPASLVVAVGLAVTSAAPAPAQTARQGTAPTTAKPNFSGSWSLDRSISNDPSHATFDASSNPSGQRSGGRNGRGDGGFGGRGGLGGFGGLGRNSNRDTVSTASPDERTRLRELTDLVKRSSAVLVISHSEPTLAITDSQDHTQLFQTNGRTDQHQLASVVVESTSHWDDSRLVTEYTLSKTRKMVYTYTLVPKTTQLVIRIRLSRSESERVGSSEIKLVYNRTPSAR